MQKSAERGDLATALSLPLSGAQDLRGVRGQEGQVHFVRKKKTKRGVKHTTLGCPATSGYVLAFDFSSTCKLFYPLSVEMYSIRHRVP